MDGERALVTGSTAGIGRAIAVAFAAQGAAVVVTGRNGERGDAVVREIAAAGGTAHFVAADLHDESSCTALVEAAAERLGGLTVLVNNAAGGDANDATVAEITTDGVGCDHPRRSHRADVVCARRRSRTCAAPGTAPSSTSPAGRPNGRARASRRTSRPRPA